MISYQVITSFSLLVLLFQRCLNRLRESRNELYAKRRGMGGAEQPSDVEGERESSKFIKMLMSTELKALKEEEGMDCEVGLSVCLPAYLTTVCLHISFVCLSVCLLPICSVHLPVCMPVWMHKLKCVTV